MNIMSVTLSRSSVLIDTWWNVNIIKDIYEQCRVIEF